MSMVTQLRVMEARTKIREMENRQVQTAIELQQLMAKLKEARKERNSMVLVSSKRRVGKLETEAAEVAGPSHVSRPSLEALQERQDHVDNAIDNAAEATGSGFLPSSAAGGGVDVGSHNRRRFNQYGRPYTSGQRLPEELRLQVITLIEQGTKTCAICRQLQVTRGYVWKMRKRLDL